ncbi:PREDICTED: thyrotropin receptor-like [Priapulus caudatus]|uniref:Thyrotropin receptor-like n=1 Tax=Priapulus caudatus TaxID=37621 RepID=A0ABM1EEA0_PRICU|nr:PREDICTED: thyrotropin receptor-like [Priapulus caudatus]
MAAHLSGTRLTTLPIEGLSQISELELENVPTLKTLPAVVNFERIKSAKLTYPYHCCAFENPHKANPQEYKRQLEKLIEQQERLCFSTTSTTTAPSVVTTGDYNRAKRSFDGIGGPRGFGNFHSNGGQDGLWSGSTVASRSIDVVCQNINERPRVNRIAKCIPEADAFNPCEDVMGPDLLRVTVWVVSITALLGNLTVIVVLLSSRFKISVSKFLMCNLAFADFCMGLYLLMLAAVDSHTLGEYFNHAILWQLEGGCQVAGFLTVFASQLSIFTLTIITLERWCAITYALHLNKRLKIGLARKVMVVGWGFSVVMAALPLAGVSDYSRTSICLPMKVSSYVDLGYVLALLVITMIAFAVICYCYLKMYCSIRGHDGNANSGDATVAKRMALLVFTDFACWAPIAFFGLTAAGSLPLIGISESKILLVFFYPLNSCCNPFLYAIMTRQFHRDFFILLSRYGLCQRRALKYKSDAYSQNVPSRSNNSQTNINRHASNGSILTELIALRSSKRSGSLKGEPTAVPLVAKMSSASTTKLSIVQELGSESSGSFRRLRPPEGAEAEQRLELISSAEVTKSDGELESNELLPACADTREIAAQQAGVNTPSASHRILHEKV